jgi:hypothetical protein
VKTKKKKNYLNVDITRKAKRRTTMAQLSMEALRAQFKKADTNEGGSGQNNYYPFWNMEIGEQSTVRILPDKNEDNPRGFLVEKMMHSLEINGEKKSVPCLKMYGEDCPICKVSAAFYKKDDKDNGKKYYRKKQYLAQALIISDPLPADKDTGETHEGKVRYLALGNKLYESIKDAFESGDLEYPPYLYENGTNFIIKKRQSGDYADYSRSSFAKNSSDLDEDTVEHVSSSIIDLSTLLPKHPGVDKVEAMLKAAMTGEEYNIGDSSDSDRYDSSDEDDVPTEKVGSVKEAASKSTKAKTPEPVQTKEEPVSSSDGDSEEDPEAILARLRARRKTKAE